MKKYTFQSLREIHAPILAELQDAAAAVIASGRYLMGEETSAFERELAAATGTVSAIGTGNGLDALRLIMRGYMELGRLKPGDEILAAGNTYIASILPASELGLKINLIDPDPDTHCLDLRQVEKHLSANTRMIVVTHLYGNPSWDLGAAARLRNRGILLMEDNAQAIGATVAGHPTGSLGDAAAFSFYPSKNIGALGDAGAVCSSDMELLRVIRALHNYGSDRRYIFTYTGYNSRIDELQAAMLRVKLRHLPQITAARNATARAYSESICNPHVSTPAWLDGCTQVWHQYVVRSPHRDELQKHLALNGVDTLVHYPIPPHRQECYRGVLDHLSLPLSERLANEVLSLPIAGTRPDEAREIALIINNFKPKS